MKRREFLKTTAIVSTAVLLPKIAFGSEDEYEERHHYKGHHEDCPRECEHEKGKYNRLKNKENPTVLEQKHVPMVEAPSE
ncbi:MAG: hypothetical protein D6778_01045, partial [Nitrospirae bacterium]